ncbi:MAG: succinate dehydrogenase, hydrophobic membrane anchor protein [Cocleimonas sp.]
MKQSKSNTHIAEKGSHHFLVQRITALILIPLILWFCINIALLPEATHEVVITWLRSSFNAIMMALLVITSFHHAHLGLQVIFEDYISDVNKRRKIITLVKFLSYLLMAIGLYSITTIYFGGQ